MLSRSFIPLPLLIPHPCIVHTFLNPYMTSVPSFYALSVGMSQSDIIDAGTSSIVIFRDYIESSNEKKSSRDIIFFSLFFFHSFEILHELCMKKYPFFIGVKLK